MFHPLHGGPDGKALREIHREDIRTALLELPAIHNIDLIELQSEPDHQVLNEQGEVTSVQIKEGELADVKVTVTLQ